ncbi:MAG: restriction endonuclease subunit S [Proteobacteria bacterium]|nr:restriction endonuclease subunit S [Pseudomonadota bacterium]
MMDNKLYNLPGSWQWAEIREIGDVLSGGTPSTKQPEFWGGDINWISPADLTGYKNKFITKGAKSISEEGLAKSSAKLMPAGSVHFSSRAPIGYVAISVEQLSTNQGFKSLVPASGIFNEYAYYYLKSAKQLAESKATGTTFKEISGTAFGKLPIPVPPINEQRRIVAKIEELFSDLDNGVASLRTAKAQLKTYRQSILKYAFDGKLTAKWRAENADKLETADVLLAKIKLEREKYYEQQLQDWQQAVKQWETNGKEGKKPTKPKIMKNLDVAKYEIENSVYFTKETPWVYEKIGNIVSQVSIKKMPNDCPDAPFIGMDCISKDGMKPSFLYKFNELTSAGNAFFQGNILYGRLRSYLNKTYLAEYDGVASGEFIVLDSMRAVDSKFLHLILHAHHFVDWATNQAAGDKPRVKYDQISQYVFGIPSLREQQKIVEEIESKFSVIDQLEKDIAENLKRCELLRQSILKKAFSGQLVAQDPNDEPASELLKRIKTEKAAQAPTKQKKEG